MNCLTSIPRCLQEFGFVAYEKVGEALTALVEAACRALAYIAETFANLPIWQEERQVQQQTENPFPQHVIPVAQQPKAIDTLQLNVNGTPEELEHSLSQVSEIAVRLQMVIQTSLKEIADAYEEKRMSLEKAIQKIDIIADDQSSQIITLPKFYEITLRVEIDWMSKCLNDYLGSLAKIQEGEVKTAQEKLKIKKEIDKCLTDCRQRFVDQNTDQWLIDDEDLIGKHEQVIESYNLVFSNPEVIQLESDLDEALAYLKKWEEGSQEKIEFAVTTTKMYAHAEIEVQVALQGKYEELISLLKDKHDFSVDDEDESRQTRTTSSLVTLLESPQAPRSFQGSPIQPRTPVRFVADASTTTTIRVPGSRGSDVYPQNISNPNGVSPQKSSLTQRRLNFENEG